MKKNTVLWLEIVFAVVSILVLSFVESDPGSAMTALRVYVLAMIGFTITLVVAVRFYQRQCERFICF